MLIDWLKMVNAYPAEDCTLIGLLMVRRAMQRQNIGLVICGEIESELRASGCKEIFLCYAETSQCSRKLWLINGFLEMGDVDEYHSLRLVAMEKKLI